MVNEESESPPEELPPRAEPVSHSERRLQALSVPTFLSLWSYPGVFRDQGSGEGRTGGKEVCDLLVVFENHIVIFSDKTCAFPDDSDLSAAWRRWYRRAVVKSAVQVRGAERWIRTYPERLFLDRNCKHRFPYPLPDPTLARFHRIVVAGGAGGSCKKHMGGNGSLMLRFDSSFTGDQPFVVGRPDDKPGLVHVFDDFTLGTVLRTVDTISDLVGYLSAKEALLESGKSIWAAGEEELLAHYLKNAGADGQHRFSVPRGATSLAFSEGHWTEFERNQQRIAQVEANQVSYAWDGLIERFTHFATTGGLEFRSYSRIADFERSIRLMAREPRTKRRMLAKALLGIMEKPTAGTERATRVLPPFEPGDPYYVFLALMRPPERTEVEYRSARRNLLESLCLVTRARWENATDIVGIATNPIQSQDMSEDLLYLDGRGWTPDAQRDAERLQAELGLLTNLTLRAYHESEYPDPAVRATHSLQAAPIRVGRNDPCPCQSGRKYKKCCGRAR